MSDSVRAEHNIPPVFDENSRVLILGSFPSVKSREQEFFYAHPRNRFWRVAASAAGCAVPRTVEEKKSFLLRNHIALWDVIASCDISGSSDSSIRNVTANDIKSIIDNSRVSAVYANGTTAYRLYNRFVYPALGINAVLLPSTSPANARMTEEELISEWKKIFTEVY